jgi:hypothetical protein
MLMIKEKAEGPDRRLYLSDPSVSICYYMNAAFFAYWMPFAFQYALILFCSDTGSGT